MIIAVDDFCIASFDDPVDCTLSLGSCRAERSDFAENLTVNALPFRQCPQVVTASGKGSVMSQIKLAALLMMPLAFFCAVAAAQNQQQPDSAVKSTAPTKLNPQTQTSRPVKTQPQKKVYSSHVASARKRAPVQRPVTDILPTSCTTSEYVVPPGDVYGSYVPYVAPSQP